MALLILKEGEVGMNQAELRRNRPFPITHTFTMHRATSFHILLYDMKLLATVRVDAGGIMREVGYSEDRAREIHSTFFKRIVVCIYFIFHSF